MFLAILTILVLCILASGAVFYFLMCEEKLRAKKKSEEKARIEQLDRALNEFGGKEKDLNGQISKLKGELQAAQELLKKEELNKKDLEAKIQELNAQLEKSNKDLSSTTQMYEGLKEQYNELEDVAEKMRRDLDGSVKDLNKTTEAQKDGNTEK